jgi:hypothetical protein
MGHSHLRTQQGRTMVPRIVMFLSRTENFDGRLLNSAGTNDGATHCGNPFGGNIDTDSEISAGANDTYSTHLRTPLQGFGAFALVSGHISITTLCSSQASELERLSQCRPLSVVTPRRVRGLVNSMSLGGASRSSPAGC